MDTNDPRHSSKKAADALQNYAGANLTETEATQAATILIGQFLNSSKGDEIFLNSLAALLSNFPRSVIEDCINPKIGFAITSNFLSIHEVNEWCCKRAYRYDQIIARERRIAQQLAERNQN